MILFVTGSRHLTDAYLVARTLELACEGNPDITELWHGDAHGADRLAAHWAAGRGLTVRAFPAEWDRFGRSAGPRRNATMADRLPADACCLAFAPPGWTRQRALAAVRAGQFGRLRDCLGPGTRDMVDRLWRAGRTIKLVWADTSISVFVPSADPRERVAPRPDLAVPVSAADGPAGYVHGVDEEGKGEPPPVFDDVSLRPAQAPGAPRERSHNARADARHNVGDLVHDRDGQPWRVVYVSGDGGSVRLRPAHLDRHAGRETSLQSQRFLNLVPTRVP